MKISCESGEREFLNHSLRVVVGLGCMLILVVAAYFSASRPDTVGTDTYNYRLLYNKIASGEDYRITEPVFVSLIELSNFMGMGHKTYFFLVSFLSASFLLFFFHKLALLNSRWSSVSRWAFLFLTLAVTLIFPLYHNFQINIIRSGLAVPVFLLGAYYFHIRRIWLATFILCVSIATHYTMVLFVPFLVLLRLPLNSHVFFYLLLSSLYCIGATKALISVFLSVIAKIGFLNYYLGYFQVERMNYSAGIRLDFLLFSTLFWWLCYLQRRSPIGEFLFLLYSSLVYPFLIFGFIAYSDRLLTPAWILIPPILVLVLARFFRSKMLLLIVAFLMSIVSFLMFLLLTGLIDVGF